MPELLDTPIEIAAKPAVNCNEAWISAGGIQMFPYGPDGGAARLVCNFGAVGRLPDGSGIFHPEFNRSLIWNDIAAKIQELGVAAQAAASTGDMARAAAIGELAQRAATAFSDLPKLLIDLAKYEGVLNVEAE